MSTRWYPLYQRGNPQLRVFLPNFWLKLIRPTHEQPENIVQFACSMEMTKIDIKNYLEKIYKIPVMDVRTRIDPGKTKRDNVLGYVTKEEDTKLAYITLEKDVKFTFPELFPSDSETKTKRRDDEKALDESKENYKKYLTRNQNRKGMPGWFSI